ARAVRAGVVITAARDLRPGTGRATDIEDRVEARAGAASLDRRRARDRRSPLEDLLGRGARVAAAAGLRARAARRAAEGPAPGRGSRSGCCRPPRAWWSSSIERTPRLEAEHRGWQSR